MSFDGYFLFFERMMDIRYRSKYILYTYSKYFFRGDRV